MDKEKKYGKFTLAIHSGSDIEDAYGASSIPIYQSSNFIFKNAEDGAKRFAGESSGYIYTRMGNPTIRALEDAVSTLEGGYRGLGASTGMSAITAVYMTYLDKDSHIVSTDAVYGPSRVVIERDFNRFGVQSTYLDTSNIENVKNAIRPNTKILYIETPANPTMSITDIEACAKIAKEHNIPLVVDNTFMSPFLQRPIELGATVVVHSLTKFLNGHSDIVGGMIVTSNQTEFERIKKVHYYMGGTMDPHQAWLVLRGVKTLPLRLEKAQSTAERLAEYLSKHPKIEWVKYPGLKSHPQYELAKKQQDGSGSMISFSVKGGVEAGKKLMDNVKLALLAVSLGGIETLIQHPASMTHAAVPRDQRLSSGITDGLIRYSVGCEDYQDLENDLENALKHI